MTGHTGAPIRGKRIATALAVVLASFLPAVGPVWAQEASSVTGVVTDAETGEPIEEVSVAIGGGNLGFSDSEGRYVVEVPPGDHLATFDQSGYQRLETQVTVGAGETVQLDVALEPAPSGNVAGMVTDGSTGAPLVGVLVNIFVGATCESPSAPFLALTETDVGGRFVSETLAAGPAVVEVSHSGYKTYQTEIEILDGVVVEVSIALVPDDSSEPTISCPPQSPVTEVDQDDEGELPFTGTGVAPLVGLGVVTLALGSLTLAAAGRETREST